MRVFLATVVLASFLAASSADSQPLRFERLTLDHGLSSNYVRTITQDRHGFIWIGTEDGLNRYDGYSFRSFKKNPRRGGSLTDNRVLALHEDGAGTLWVGTGAGLNRFEPSTETFVHYTLSRDDPGSSASFTVTALYEDQTGAFWIGTVDGLHLFDREAGTSVVFRHVQDEDATLSDDHVTAILEDQHGVLWIGTDDGGLNRFDRQTGTFAAYRHERRNPHSLRGDRISALLEDKAGTLWVATSNLPDGRAVHRFDRETETFHAVAFSAGDQTDPAYSPTAMLQTRDGVFWITTLNLIGGDTRRSGLHRFEPSTGEFTSYGYDPSDPHSLSWFYVTSIYEDRSENLWIGTSRGLNRLDRGQIKFGLIKLVPEDPYHLTDNIYGLHQDGEGVLWLGSSGFGLASYDTRTGLSDRFSVDPTDPDSLSSGTVTGITSDSAGMLWLGTGYGLSRYDPSARRFETYRHDAADPNSLAEDRVLALHVDDDGIVWAGTANGLSRFDPRTRSFTTYRHDPHDPRSLSGNYISVIFEDSRGLLWVGTNTHPTQGTHTGPAGLSVFDKATEAAVVFRHAPGDASSISDDGINAIHEDGSNRIWIGTNQGLNLFDRSTQRFTHYLEEDGLPSAGIMGILEDNEGNLWLSYDAGGLSRFDPGAETFRHFHVADGLQNMRFNRGAYFHNSAGEMFFGGVSGVNHFLPSNIEANTEVPPVVVTRFGTRAGTAWSVGALVEYGEIVLPYRDNAFSVEFAALNFRMPERNQYAYLLEGFDREWVYSETRRYASYTNLRPGTYTFRVKGSNNDGVWNEEGASIRISVLSPWWLTWWAYAFYGVIAAGGVLAVDRYQRRRLIKREREQARERELEQKREIERAYEELKRTQAQLVQQEKLASLGALTAGIAHEIKNPLNFINNFSQLTVELADELIEERTTNPLAPLQSLGDIFDDIRLNASKIDHHGKRADAIVKSMLQHSRGGSGTRETVDLNALVEEYVGLAYHGKRAQSSGFDVEIERDYAPDVGSVELVPQDIGRVILNLIGNAFDAVSESTESDAARNPRVRVETHRTRNALRITISDNGPGIPQGIRVRLFEPFFTTKPAGQGTGLGLSLSHDIVTQGHGGSLEVDDAPGGGAAFTIQIPIS